MAAFLAKIPMILQVAGMVLMGLVIAATALVHAISPKGDAFMQSVDSGLLKALSFLPTLGINPRTQAMEAALKDLQAQLAAAQQAPAPAPAAQKPVA